MRFIFALLFLLCGTALAQDNYPSRPVHIVVPYTPGTGADILARVFGPKLSERMKAGFVVDNRPGDTGNIGAAQVAKSPPDGYALLLTATSFSTNPALKPAPFDPVKDFAPVILLSTGALGVYVHPQVPAKSMREFVELVRSQPGKLHYSSPGNGGPQHLAMELLKLDTKIDIVHVPYKGAGPAVIDMIAGQVSMGFSALPSSLPHARSGKLRAIAVTGPKRSEVAPDLPTFVEQGFPAIDVVSWYGVLFPARTPPEIIKRMSDEVARIVRLPDVKTRLLDTGIEVVGSTPEQFAAFIRSEVERYGNVVRASGAKLD